MKERVFIDTGFWIALFDTKDNKVLKSEKLPNSGSTIIAEMKIRTWAKRNGLVVE